MSRLEEQEKLVTAEGLYRRALSLDDLNPEAQEALHKITDTIQVSGPQHAHNTRASGKLADEHCVYFRLICIRKTKQVMHTQYIGSK